MTLRICYRGEREGLELVQSYLSDTVLLNMISRLLYDEFDGQILLEQWDYPAFKEATIQPNFWLDTEKL